MQLHTHLTLPGTGRVRLRLPQARDRADLVALFASVGVAVDSVYLQRILRFEPQHRLIVCAIRWTADGEEVVGLGAVRFDGSEVDLLIVDEDRAPGLRDGLATVLRDAADDRRRAA